MKTHFIDVLIYDFDNVLAATKKRGRGILLQCAAHAGIKIAPETMDAIAKKYAGMNAPAFLRKIFVDEIGVDEETFRIIKEAERKIDDETPIPLIPGAKEILQLVKTKYRNSQGNPFAFTVFSGREHKNLAKALRSLEILQYFELVQSANGIWFPQKDRKEVSVQQVYSAKNDPAALALHCWILKHNLRLDPFKAVYLDDSTKNIDMLLNDHPVLVGVTTGDDDFDAWRLRGWPEERILGSIRELPRFIEQFRGLK